MGVDEDELLNITDLPEDLKTIFTNDKFKIGYAGTIGSANQINQIIDAAYILKDNEKIHFYILGNGPKKQDYIDYVKSLHLNNITFLDAIPKESVVTFLKNCDVLVNPWKNSSIYNYGVSPNKWIDYMLSARPILVPYNGFRNIINEAKCGEFIDAENPFLLSKKIEEYSLKNKEELLETGLNGYNYLLENLTYRKLSKDYINLFSIK